MASKPMTVAEVAQLGFELSMEHYREYTLLAFKTLTDGQVKQLRQDAFKVIHFYENETDAELWEQLKQFPDPDTMQPDPVTGQVDPYGVRSMAETWIEKWGQLNAAVGKEEVEA